MRNGYIQHRPLFGRAKYEHRRIAEERLRRRLKRWEVVHHMNGRPDDNRPENLCVMSWYNHNVYHSWFRWFREKYSKYPTRETQLRRLRELKGILLVEPSEAHRRRAG